jgi:hypothetical protein
MGRRWLDSNSRRFTADILRDFCTISLTLTEQFARFERSGHLSFAILRDLLGDAANKGPLWRLKDLSHHLLRDAKDSSSEARLLDWTIGYIFHEVVKLMEDSHQHRYYTPRILGVMENVLSPEVAPLAGDFLTITRETHSDMAQGVNRVKRLLAHGRTFFYLHMNQGGGNLFVARFLHDNEPQVRAVFQEEYASLLKALYDDNPERLHLDAARSLLEGGYRDKAEQAVKKTLAITPHCPEAGQLLTRIRQETVSAAAV